VGRKLQCQTQQRDGVQSTTSELSGCRSVWTTGRMDNGRMERTTTQGYYRSRYVVTFVDYRCTMERMGLHQSSTLQLLSSIRACCFEWQFHLDNSTLEPFHIITFQLSHVEIECVFCQATLTRI